MAKRRKERKTYKYECSLTGETYILTEKVKNPDELTSVQAWYEMNPEHDDRPEDIKKALGSVITKEEREAQNAALFSEEPK